MTSPFGPMLLIANPRAGRGRVERSMPQIQALLSERGLEHEIRFTEGRGHATELAREALSRGVRFLVPVGGDGTIHQVLNGIMKDDVAAEGCVMGVISLGRGSDFVRTFGIPAHPSHAAAHLDGGESFPIDVGKLTYTVDGAIEVRYFANVAEVGLGPEAVARADRLPRWLGPFVYFVAFWLAVRKHKPAQVEVDMIDRTYSGKMNNLIVANGQFFGGGMKIAPKAAPTDGLLDIQIEHARKRDAIALMPKVFKGQHVPHPDILEAKRAKLSITADRPLLIEADGEVLGRTPASFEVLKDALTLKV